jgi:hypothetical protein
MPRINANEYWFFNSLHCLFLSQENTSLYRKHLKRYRIGFPTVFWAPLSWFYFDIWIFLCK